ncbi:MULTISPECIES: phosphonate C-P lyase system protein PhnG [Agrobacterium]|uniref:Alpha-D-ribose 1-methylphosphonate 5-triphosphate synthase subunit PhnG n=1 Tax=Agrobacterium rosae TaxID=1972867 RepID=A0A1R3TYK2_9HYPH|nr:MULTISPECIES: phosphonate C-P lyase system protein PhnG [Agrobacterium]MBN7806746.1 phosphonate C-P lyase system protein PhnG [Agrobacterium rosae]MDX8304080.1 phosphonate C-P lyase system protein PhnG [Agrobacterium rosae]POO55126.1 phosphonate C-P lyase system protein PhnG [Agrobacterium rosae]SCX24395.1 Alpha-D-ribose 1-methylphosphonate 5-triphosphate synthase subunit PhnG [Agrobacterium rosae]SCX24939.1 Alpha-D-ribose 1-methylphosphonate 5-triphosphate synthase subunit PhnG [Agrobacter
MMEVFNRKQALDILANAPADVLLQTYGVLEAQMPRAAPVRGPEIGTVMVRGKIGGGGAAFNLGEASVTRATVKLATGEVGHSIVLGRDQRKAHIVAHLDALRQSPDWVARIDDEIVRPALAILEDTKLRRAEETEATKVDFFTVARGED